jgi:hypothetical protein
VAGSQQLHVAAVGPDGQQLSEIVLEVGEPWTPEGDVSSSARRSLLGKWTGRRVVRCVSATPFLALFTPPPIPTSLMFPCVHVYLPPCVCVGGDVSSSAQRSLLGKETWLWVCACVIPPLPTSLSCFAPWLAGCGRSAAPRGGGGRQLHSACGLTRRGCGLRPALAAALSDTAMHRQPT